MATQQKSPEIRFAGFTEDWKATEFGRLMQITSASRVHKNEWTKSGVPFFRSSDVVSAFKGKENIQAFISFELFQELSSKSGRPKLNDLLVTGGGSIGIPYLVKNDNPLYFKDADLLWLKNSDKLDSHFLYSFFTSDIFKKYVESITHIGTISHYTVEQAKSTPIKVPEIGEQNKISQLFGNLNSLIINHQTQLTKLKNLKKAMLTKMFPQNGATLPEIRFKGFDGDWEECRLSDVTEYQNGKGYESDQSKYGKYELINLNSISIDGGLKPSGKYIDKAELTLNKDDLVMILSDVGHGDLLGRVAIIPQDDKYVLNQRVALLRPNWKVLPLFLYYTINVNQVYFKKQGAGMSQLNISKSSVEDFEFLFPSNIDEQNKISKYFENLDDLIKNHKEQLKKLNNIKKACLSKLFVA